MISLLLSSRSRFRLTLLGGFRVHGGAGRSFAIPPRKAQALLAYLALTPDGVRSREALTSLLWGEAGRDQARGSLRQALFVLRESMGTLRDCLSVESDRVRLDGRLAEVDVWTWQRLLEVGEPEALQEASRLYKGELLQGFDLREAPFMEWLIGERHRIHELAIDGMEKLLHHLREANQDPEAIQVALRILSLDPLHERARRALISLYEDRGRSGAAMQQFMAHTRIAERTFAQRTPAASSRSLSLAPAALPFDSAAPAWGGSRVRLGPLARQSKRMLVVDADPMTRTRLQAALVSAGHRVEVASDGAEALLRVGAVDFDAILVDVDVPTLSGLQIVEILRKRQPPIPVILLTARGGPELEAESFARGAADYIRKPVTGSVLRARLDNVLARAQRWSVSPGGV